MRQATLPFYGKALALCLNVALLGACGSQDAPGTPFGATTLRQTLNHRPNNIPNQGRIDRLSGDHILDLRFVMSLEQEDELDEIIAQSHDPKSVHYGAVYSPEEFRARHLPSEAHRAQVRNLLRDAGFVLSETDGPGHIIAARVRSSDAERFFNTELISYIHPSTGERVHAPRGQIAVPAAMKLTAIHGLATPPKRRPHFWRERSFSSFFHRSQPFSAAQIRSAYQIPAEATGKGQTIGVVELDGYDQADLAAYAEANELRLVPTRRILLNGYDGKVIDKEAQVEVTMDIELINALAPGADEIRVFSAANQSSAALDIYHEIANPTTSDKKLITSISTSWGIPEDEMTDADLHAEAAVFKQMAAQGQTLFAAAGDSGARDDGRSLSVDDPAAHPHVVAVGGTTLTQDNGEWKKESTWKNGGGGISQTWAAPAWQKSLDPSLSHGSISHRNVPDVALNSDPRTGYNVVVGGSSMTVGGTSCAAPLWAAFLALVNESRDNAQKAPMGFLTPALYEIGANGGGTTQFHDIEDQTSNGYFQAVEGFDDATGWGSFVGDKLIDALTSK